MMADEASDAIRHRSPLPPEGPEIWGHPEWHTVQR